MEQNYDPRLLELVKYTNLYYRVNKDLTYQENLLGLIEELKKNPIGLILSLSVQTYYYLEDCLKNGQAKEYARNDFYQDDFDLLVKLNVINTKANMINPAYLDIIKLIMSKPMAKQFAYAVSLLKGIIDTYGIIEITKAQEILGQFVKDTKHFSAINIFKSSNLLNAYACIKDDNFVHSVIEDDDVYHSLLSYRKSIQIPLDYKIFKGVDYIKYGSDYRFEPFKAYFKEETFINLFQTHWFNKKIYATKTCVENKLIKQGEEQIIELLNLAYPKWGLKGHNIDEYVKLDKESK